MNSERKKSFDLKAAGTLTADFLLWCLGCLLYSTGVVIFTTPMHFVTGGLTGIAVIVHHLVPAVPIGAFVFVANIPLFIISWKVFGYKFIIRTMVATSLLSGFIDLTQFIGEKYDLLFNGDEKLVAAIFGGVLCGAGLGIVFSSGATTGGIDILARLLRIKLPHISVGKLVLACDFIVVLLNGLVSKSIESVLYSLIIIFISSQAVDYVVSGMSHSKMLLIMTKDPEQVCRDIIKFCGRGVSVIPVRGGYTGQEREMLMCVVRAHEVAAVRKIVARYDDKPFIIITDSSEVLGQGFKSHKDTL
ncbi:MAG: YitT family protein [Oscillospiraceae bacterium]|nr:YitT family protein [Oscillospiraceae bacterium]